MDSLRLQPGTDQMRRTVGQQRHQEIEADSPVQPVEDGH